MSFSYSKIRLLASVFVLGLLFAGNVQASQGVYAMGVDTVAGQKALLKAVNFSPETQVVFLVRLPDGSQLRQLEKTNASGTADAVLDGLHTRMSGEYLLRAESSDASKTTTKTSFVVYPGALSLKDSRLELDKTVLMAGGGEQATATVRLADQFGNPLNGRAVKMFSSNKSDTFVPSMTMTDDSGKAVFKYTPFSQGLAVLMALDTTEDQILQERLNISILDGSKMMSDAGGDYLPKAYAAAFGPLAGFEIEGVPDNLSKGQNVSFTVKAVDEDGMVVEDYTGTIRFSAEGENSTAVTMPDNYKYLATDLGVHTFSLGLSFAENGTYKIIVTDLNDKFKTGEQTVVVGDSAGSDGSGTGEKPVISMPAPGTYSQAVQTVSGTAKNGSTVRIFSNNEEVGSVPAGPTGRFSYQTSPLADGKNVLYVVSQDVISLETLGTSDTVEINIDTTPPKIDELRLDPNTNITPGSVINVTVFSEENLSQAALIFNFDIIELNASVSDRSAYVGTVQAPAESGEYSISVLLVDELQNEITYQETAKVTVSDDGGTAQNLLEEPTNGELPGETVAPTVVSGAPSQVGGLIAYGLDGRVTLVWDAATDDSMVKFYRVYYGETLQSMTNKIDTRDASTTWYIPNLENGKEYFFAVAAVDDQGNESENRSEIVSGIPFVLEVKTVISDQPIVPLEQPDLHGAAYGGPYPVRTTDTGPGILLLLAGSVAAGLVLRKKK